MLNNRKTPLSWGRMLLVIACLTLLAVALAQAEEAKPRSTSELKKDLRTSQQELKKMQDLQRKMKSAGRESSNSTRQKLAEDLRQHMVSCILRREDDLGMEHTIKMHGQTTQSGTTDAAEAGAPVGTSSAKQIKNLANMEGPNADRLRQMSRMQSIFVSTQKIQRSAIEKQGDSFDMYMDKLVRYEQQLQLWTDALQGEVDAREKPAEDDSESGDLEGGTDQ